MDKRVEIRESIIWEFSGSYPDVPTAEGVNVEALTRGDADPVFVTLPIGKIGVVSGNRRYYDDVFAGELVGQVISKRPPGLMGHIPQFERDSTHRPAEIDWIGAVREGDMVWGKGYIPPGAVREYMRRRKAVNGEIATSIYGTAEQEWDEALEAWRVVNFELESIDLVPPERAGVRDLAAVPMITAEMQRGGTEGQNRESEETGMEITKEVRLKVIETLTGQDVKLIPDEVVNAIRRQALEDVAEIGLVAELRQALGLDDKADLVSAVRELGVQVEQHRRAAVEARIAALAGERVKVDDESQSIREMVVALVRAERPETPEAVVEAFERVMARSYVKATLQRFIAEAMGPPQGTPLNTPEGEDGRGESYIIIPEDEKA